MKQYNIILTLAITLLFTFSWAKAKAQDFDSIQVQQVVDTNQVIKKAPKVKEPKLSDSAMAIVNFIKTGDKYAYGSEKRFEKAIESYKMAEQMGATDEYLWYQLGFSYFQIKQYSKARPYFVQVLNQDSLSKNKTYYYMGRIEQLIYEFDSAITYFEQYRQSLSPEELNINNKELKKRIKECEIGKEMKANSTDAYIDLMDTNINSVFVEYAPIVSTNDSFMVFTSRRPNNIGAGRDQNGVFFEDIYFTQRDSNGNWTTAQNIGKPINTAAHDASAGLSADGNKLVVYRSSGNGDLYLSTRTANQWSKPKKFNKNINTSSHEATASFSYDNLKLYFSSDREGGYGGHDIYQSDLDVKAKWGFPKNIGSKINTAYDEMTLIAMPDGKTFYFTSNGHNTMGGLDIFKITYQDSVWSEPVNLGYPINTPGDDILYSITADGKKAYIASSRDEAQMHDIYELSFMEKSKPILDDLDGDFLAISKYGIGLPVAEAAVNIDKMNLTVLKGIISDEYTRAPIFAQIELTDNATNKVIATFSSNEQSGSYLVSLPSGKDYGIAVKAENCLFYSDNITIAKEKGYKEIIKDISLLRIEVGSKVVLKNIFFATGKSTLTTSSETELQNLLKLLNDIPILKIEISGHTDNVGSVAKNKTLSQERARAVVKYLVEKGIATDRLVYKGYGFDQPIASNATKEGRQQNRRTEFKVIAR